MGRQQPEGPQLKYPRLQEQSVGADGASPKYEAWDESELDQVPENER